MVKVTVVGLLPPPPFPPPLPELPPHPDNMRAAEAKTEIRIRAQDIRKPLEVSLEDVSFEARLSGVINASEFYTGKLVLHRAKR
jgi:hypothetical protein